jgi:hypothetical protein
MEQRPVAFRIRDDRIDQQLLSAAQHHAHQGTLAEAEAREGLGAVSLAEIVQPEEGSGPEHGHFGGKTQLFWWFIYRLFVPGGPLEHPRAFPAKAVLLTDVFVPPIAWGGTAYISVWASLGWPEGQPVLVPFPRVPEVLMEEDAKATFADSCRAYRGLVADTLDRVNLIAPAALALADQAAADSS